MYQALLGTGVRTMRKTDKTPALRKCLSDDPVKGQQTMFCGLVWHISCFSGMQSHFIYILSVPFHTTVTVLAKKKNI